MKSNPKSKSFCSVLVAIYYHVSIPAGACRLCRSVHAWGHVSGSSNSGKLAIHTRHEQAAVCQSLDVKVPPSVPYLAPQRTDLFTERY